MSHVKKTICPLDCPDTCALLATVEDNQVKALAGDPEHPYTKGVICRKMRSYPERLHAANRLLYPLVRTGKKGAGQFARIGWDEAWDRLVNGLQTVIANHGPEAVMPFCYAGNMGLINRFAGFPFFHRLGATQIEQTICSAAASGGWKLGCGPVGGTPPERAAEASLIVAWGINVRVTNLHFWSYIKQARATGARLLVIDPYRNETAGLADQYVPVKPGGDGALALGILRCLLLSGNRVDHRFIDEETTGFAELADYLRTISLADCAGQSGVPQATIRDLADQFAAQPRTFIRIGVGLTRNSRGGMAVRAITSLAAALGLFDGRPGRGVLLFSGAFSGDSDTLRRPDLLAGAPRTVNMIHLGHALTKLTPPIHALFVYNANPLSVAPDSAAVRDGLSRPDLFTIVHEQVMTPTARFADLILPATTFLENRDVYRPYGHFFLGFADRAVPPAGETISNFDLFQTLAGKMGFVDPPFAQTIDDRIEHYLASVPELPEGFAPDSFYAGAWAASKLARQDGSVFTCAGYRFHFTIAAQPGVPAHACLTEAAEFDNPALCSRFPLQLITPPTSRLLNSTFGERYPDEPGTILVHPRDAADRGIGEGEMALLLNGRGRTVRRTVVTEDTQPGVVVAEGLYWPVGDSGTGINELISQQCADIGGGALFHESLVEIQPVRQV